MREIVALLRDHRIFAPASEASRSALAETSELLTLRSGELILEAGSVADRVYALTTGKVRVFQSGREEQQVVAKLFSAPAIFGESEAIAGVPWIVTVEAVEPCTVVSMSPRALLEFFASEPSAGIRMIIDLSIRLAISSDHERSLTFDPSTVRLANYLLDHAKATNPPNTSWPRVLLNQKQLAAAIGVTRRSVATDIGSWRKEGLLLLEDGAYVIKNVPGLEKYADPGRLSVAYSFTEALEALWPGGSPDSQTVPRDGDT